MMKLATFLTLLNRYKMYLRVTLLIRGFDQICMRIVLLHRAEIGQRSWRCLVALSRTCNGSMAYTLGVGISFSYSKGFLLLINY
jgi:hypothetical protein